MIIGVFRVNRDPIIMVSHGQERFRSERILMRIWFDLAANPFRRAVPTAFIVTVTMKQWARNNMITRYQNTGYKQLISKLDQFGIIFLSCSSILNMAIWSFPLYQTNKLWQEHVFIRGNQSHPNLHVNLFICMCKVWDSGSFIEFWHKHLTLPHVPLSGVGVSSNIQTLQVWSDMEYGVMVE